MNKEWKYTNCLTRHSEGRYGESPVEFRQSGSSETDYPGNKCLIVNPGGTISSAYLYSVMYYDDRGRVVQTKSNNALSGGTEKEYFAYDFTGQPKSRKHIHQAAGKTTQTEVYDNTYDYAERLIKTTHKLNEGATTTIAENTYDELGRLKTNKKGGQANLNATYAYTIRTWVKSITSPLFTETLFYNEQYGGSAKRYNGNLSAMSWKPADETDTRGYAFSYDNLSRLTAANYLVNGSANTNYKTAYTYDKQGNMLTLQRYGKTTAAAYGLIDNLTMNYNGNQLLKVEDAAANITIAESADFKNYNNVATEYTCNANGAMTKDLNKGISDIQYNSLNLPRLMDIKSPVAEARNEYTYSALGQKLKVVQNRNPNYSTTPLNGVGSAINTSSLSLSKTTEYIGNVIYENGTLKRILIDGGYIEGGVYYYFLTDHQGNNRLVVNADGAVIQKNHYYPFGMPVAETPIAEQGKQPYKYNGKELDMMNGLNQYDYSARFYDPAIARFSTMDPMAEKYYSISPYAYCGNNPVNAVDPTGKDLFDLQGNLISKDNTNIIRIQLPHNTETTLSGFYTNDGSLFAISKILSYYGNEVGVKGMVTTSPEGSKDSNSNLAFTKGNNVYVNTKDNGISSMLDNMENMKSALFHEKVHQERGQGFIKITNVQHAFVYGKQILDKSFETTTKEFKIGTIGSLVKLLLTSSHKDLNDNYNSVVNTVEDVNKIIKEYGYQIRMSYDGSGNISSINAIEYDKKQ